jgi:hypothetical protein
MEGPANSVVCEGGCHCGAVRYRVRLPRTLDVLDCDCSICRKAGYLHVTVPHGRFELLAGGQDLVEYRFNTGAARHLFCGRCGIKSFYQPRSHPDAWSLNLRCLNLPPDVRVEIRPFRGSRWEQHIGEISDATSF